MMTKDDILTDDYVAGLLASEAQDCSIKYSAMGMNAYQSDKKPVHKPKPNTRFLRHIIKDTDAHNKNLLAKETAESKARLDNLEQVEEAKRLRLNPNANDIRRRQMGDIHAILGNKQRSRKERRSSSDKHRSNQESRQNSDPGSGGTKDRGIFTDRHRQTDKGRPKEAKYGKSSEQESGQSSKSSRKLNRTPESSSNSRENKKRGDKHSLRTSSDRHRERFRSRSPSNRRRPHRQRSPPLRSPGDESSDDLMAPQPAPKPRGRGALAGASGIDRRFSESYDPTEDRQTDGAGGDWCEAIEDYRNHQKIRQQGIGADSLHAQGSESAEAQKETVTWSKAGEEREWDREKYTTNIDSL